MPLTRSYLEVARDVRRRAGDRSVAQARAAAVGSLAELAAALEVLKQERPDASAVAAALAPLRALEDRIAEVYAAVVDEPKGERHRVCFASDCPWPFSTLGHDPCGHSLGAYDVRTGPRS